MQAPSSAETPRRAFSKHAGTNCIATQVLQLTAEADKLVLNHSNKGLKRHHFAQTNSGQITAMSYCQHIDFTQHPASYGPVHVTTTVLLTASHILSLIVPRPRKRCTGTASA